MLLLIASVLSLFMFNSCKEVTVKGRVISHATTADRYGDIGYFTIAIFDDGGIRSIQGLKYYIVPVNGTIYYTYYTY